MRTSTLTFGILPFLFTACASTRFASTWSDPGTEARPLAKIAVIVIAKETAPARTAEDALVARLAPGTQAVPSHAFAPGTTDGDALKAKLHEGRFDGALVARVVGVDKSLEYVPELHTGVAVGLHDFGAYYRASYAGAWTPGRVEERVTVRVEADLYDVAAGKLVWTGVTTTFEPSSTSALVEGNAEVIVAELRERGWIAPAPK